MGRQIFQNVNLANAKIRTRHHIHHTKGADMHAFGGANRGAGIKMRRLQRDAARSIGPGDGIAAHLFGLLEKFSRVTRPIAMLKKLLEIRNHQMIRFHDCVLTNRALPGGEHLLEIQRITGLLALRRHRHREQALGVVFNEANERHWHLQQRASGITQGHQFGLMF